MHQNAHLREAYNGRGLSALVNLFVIVVTYGQKVTNINRFIHSRYLCFFFLFTCFVLFSFLILNQFRIPVG